MLIKFILNKPYKHIIRGEITMNLAILLVTIYIFFINIGYAVYEFQNNNKLAGVCTILLNLFMIIFVNYVTFNFV